MESMYSSVIVTCYVLCRICRSCTRTSMAWKRCLTWGNTSSGTKPLFVSVYVCDGNFIPITEEIYLTLFISFAGWCVRQFDMNSMKLMRFYTSKYPNILVVQRITKIMVRIISRLLGHKFFRSAAAKKK